MINPTEGFSVLSLADAFVAFADRGRWELDPKPLGKTLGSFVLP